MESYFSNCENYEVLETWIHRAAPRAYILTLLKLDNGNYMVRYLKGDEGQEYGASKEMVTFSSLGSAESFLQGLIMMIRDLGTFERV